MARSSTIKQADVKRVVGGALAAGFAVGRVEVEVEAGKIIVHREQESVETLMSPLEAWRAGRDPR
jgi:hypothetical protein